MTSPAGAPRPTTPRPTRWSRSTPPPRGSNTPTSKSVIVRLESQSGRDSGVADSSDAGRVGGAGGDKRSTDPVQLS